MTQQSAKRLRVAVVGYGQIARLHLPLLAADGHQPAWLIGRLPERTRSFAEEWGFLRHSTELTDALADPSVDAVYLCTPNELHADQALDCLAAGKHVFVEIPLAMSFAEGQAIQQLSERLGLTVMVGHNHRYLGGARWIRERVRSGELNLLSIAARYLLLRRDNVGSSGYVRSWTDSLLWHHGQHAVDLILWLLGVTEPGVVEVLPAFGRSHQQTGLPMDVSISVRTPAGQLGTALLSYNSFTNVYDYVVMARERTLILGGGQLRDGELVVDDHVADQVAGGDGARRRQHREFVAAVSEGRQSTTDAAAVLPALDALQRTQDAFEQWLVAAGN